MDDNFLFELQIDLENKNQEVVIVQPNEGLIEIASYPDDYLKNLILISKPKEKKENAIFLWPEGSYSFVGKNGFKNLIKDKFKSNQKIILGERDAFSPPKNSQRSIRNDQPTTRSIWTHFF